MNRSPAGRGVFNDWFPIAEAGELVMRSTLLRGLEHWFEESGLTQTQAAKALGITQARVSDMQTWQDRAVQSGYARPPPHEVAVSCCIQCAASAALVAPMILMTTIVAPISKPPPAASMSSHS